MVRAFKNPQRSPGTVFLSTLCWLMMIMVNPLSADDRLDIDEMLNHAGQIMETDVDRVDTILGQLEGQQQQFNDLQRESFYLLQVMHWGFLGKHSERIHLVTQVIDRVNNPNVQVKLLYELSDAYVNLGHFEDALVIMNQGIRLLPKLTEVNAKVSMLRGAVAILMSLNAFEEAQVYADRMYQTGVNANSPKDICTGIASLIRIRFRLGQRESARASMNEALAVCHQSGEKYKVMMLHALDAIDSIDARRGQQAVDFALTVLADLQAMNEYSDLVPLLEEAIARGYFQLGALEKAELYAMQAFAHLNQIVNTELNQDIAKVNAQIKRAQGDLGAALDFYDIYQLAREKVELENDTKNLAYQRVKYDNRDKTNQLELLKFKNNSLSLAQSLQKRNNDNLLLVVLLALILLIFMSILLVLTLRRQSSLAHHDFNHPSSSHAMAGFIGFAESTICTELNANGCFALIVFELDHMDVNSATTDPSAESNAELNAELNTELNNSIALSILNEVALICQKQTRSHDQFGRIDENRFVVCLLDSTEQGIHNLVERYRQAIGAITVDDPSIKLPLMASFGVALFIGDSVECQDALAIADKALLTAKAAGSGQMFVNTKGRLNAENKI